MLPLKINDKYFNLQPGDTVTISNDDRPFYKVITLPEFIPTIDKIINTGNKMKCLYIKADYNTGFILPIELLDSLYQFEMVQGEGYNETLKFINRPFDIRVIDYDTIKAADPIIKLEVLQAVAEKLKAELEQVERQINKI
jgi:hypothetical protein